MKIRNGFVSNSSTSSFIIGLDAYKNIFQLAKHMLRIMSKEDENYDEDVDYNGEDDPKYWRKNLDHLLELGVNPNIPVSFPSTNFNTYIMRKEDGFYVDTCNNVFWDDDLRGVEYDSEGWASEETYKEFENLWHYLADYDIIGRMKIYGEKKDCKNTDHILALQLQDGEWFCPICSKEKLEANQVSRHPEKYKALFFKEPPIPIEELRIKRIKSLKTELNEKNNARIADDEIERLVDLEMAMNSRFKKAIGGMIIDTRNGIILEKNGYYKLGLYNCNLETLPEELLQLEYVTELSLWKNKLKELPVDMSGMKSLRIIHLEDNLFEEFPESLSSLPVLETIEISSNQISELKDGIGSLKTIKRLQLNGNKIEKISPKIGSLKSLEQLHLVSNQLEEVPEAIGGLSNLEFLDLGNNKLSNIPESIGQIKELKKLYIGKNPLSSLPTTIMNLKKLESLSLSDTQLNNFDEIMGNLLSLTTLGLYNMKLTEIPESITKLKNLKSLNLRQNPIETLPEFLKNFEFLENLDVLFTKLRYDEKTQTIILELLRREVKLLLPKNFPEDLSISMDMIAVEQNTFDLKYTNWRYLNKIGWGFLKKGKYEESKKLASTLISKELRNPEALANGKDLLASTLSFSDRVEDLENAIRLFEEAKAIDEAFYSKDYYQNALLKLKNMRGNN